MQRPHQGWLHLQGFKISIHIHLINHHINYLITVMTSSFFFLHFFVIFSIWHMTQFFGHLKYLFMFLVERVRVFKHNSEPSLKKISKYAHVILSGLMIAFNVQNYITKINKDQNKLNSRLTSSWNCLTFCQIMIRLNWRVFL